jgi:hypothetical protein
MDCEEGLLIVFFKKGMRFPTSTFNKGLEHKTALSLLSLLCFLSLSTYFGYGPAHLVWTFSSLLCFYEAKAGAGEGYSYK